MHHHTQGRDAWVRDPLPSIHLAATLGLRPVEFSAGARTEGYARVTTDWIAGFAWPLPRAFSGAVSACRFEQGDVLYGDPTGYGEWPEEAPPLPIIQVLDPPKTARALSGDAEGNRFSVSWESPVTVDVWVAAERPDRRSTTQGRLFTCLWRGDLSLLDAETPAPDAPSTVRALQRRLPEAVPALLDRFAARARAGGQSLLLLAVDDSSDSTRVKAQAIEALLADAFEVEALSVTPVEVGVENAESLHPALLVRAIAIASADAEAIERRLARLLYSGADASAGRFSLSRHGHLTALAAG